MITREPNDGRSRYQNPKIDEDIILYYDTLQKDGELIGERFRILKRLLDELRILIDRDDQKGKRSMENFSLTENRTFSRLEKQMIWKKPKSHRTSAEEWRIASEIKGIGKILK